MSAAKGKADRAASEPAAPAESPSTTRRVMGAVPVPGFILSLLGLIAQTTLLGWAIWNAFRIRTYALVEYGYVIHEFDPWFNFRATQYLSKHGWTAFFAWFDHMSWYPLGRPVGTTIYPGLQFTSVVIHRGLRMLGKAWRLSLNDVCCLVPCWGGALCSFLMFLITWEATNSRTAGVFAAVIMAVIPAHMMRSVGGGYDNESIAMTALTLTFYMWIRSLRTPASWPIGVLTGLAYGYMVAAWGGYVFVLNMVALHAGLCVVLDWARNVYNPGLHKAYSLFFVIGTGIAMTVPVVGMTPLKSLEQILALLVFVFLQVLALSEKARVKAGVEVRSKECFRIRLRYFLGAVAALAVVAVALTPTGYFGPISSRVRGLFMQHTRTGNPLVDSVAEHQPANADAYWHYMHYCCYGWQIGVFLMPILCRQRVYAASFITLYAIVAYYFSMRMARLIILASPVASAMTGFCLGVVVDWALRQFIWSEADATVEKSTAEGKTEKGKKVQVDQHTMTGGMNYLKKAYAGARPVRMAVAVVFLGVIIFGRAWPEFNAHSEQMAHSFANPQLMFKTRLNNGQTVIIDDYREAYHWLRDKTPANSRVMAWWDYGYQITGIGNRTSIADGNTWNHEHIATLGYCLTSPVARAHSLIRHVADYVLIWSGGGGDDLAKSPHMARIGNSVYRDICPKDPLCSKFGFRAANFQDPTPMMRNSLLYNLHAHNHRPGVRIPKKYFTDVFSSRYGLVRIFKVSNVSEESREYLDNPKNWNCDEPGSWYCPGNYPQAKPWQDLLAKRNDFGQLEDFNKKKRDDDYHRQYMQRMSGGG